MGLVALILTRLVTLILIKTRLVMTNKNRRKKSKTGEKKSKTREKKSKTREKNRIAEAEDDSCSQI